MWWDIDLRISMVYVRIQSGAYMQYSIAPASTTFPIPDSTTFEDAATLPLAVMTAAIGLFKRLELPEAPQGKHPLRLRLMSIGIERS